ncbi:MAG: YdcF family protein [Phenylobacterium sp.]
MRLAAGLLVGVLIWLAGLFAFADRVNRLTPARLPEAADGVVVLTGAGSNARLDAGMAILEAGLARRLLVSGVNRGASREDIREVSKATRRLYDCCVDLGFTAADTVGNARETAGWVRAMRYRRLIVVTADWHMPRAMLELKTALPGVELQSYAAVTPALDSRRWTGSPAGVRLMIREYSKYMTVLARETVRSLGLDEALPRKATP